MISPASTLDIVQAGLRASLFASALIAAMIYYEEGVAAIKLMWGIALGKIKDRLLVGLASIGWFIVALSCVELGSYRLFETLLLGKNPAGPSDQLDKIFICIGFVGLTTGFYLPILAMKLWRGLPLRAFIYALIIAGTGVFTMTIAYLWPAL